MTSDLQSACRGNVLGATLVHPDAARIAWPRFAERRSEGFDAFRHAALARAYQGKSVDAVARGKEILAKRG